MGKRRDSRATTETRRRPREAVVGLLALSAALWIERFDTLEELRARIRRFARDFNEHWLLERHGYRSLAHARETLRQAAGA